jgi:hypothetical protein
MAFAAFMALTSASKSCSNAASEIAIGSSRARGFCNFAVASPGFAGGFSIGFFEAFALRRFYQKLNRGSY